MDYDSFIASKAVKEVATGHDPSELNEHLFDFQRAIVTWAVRRGRSAIFADTGLGKTLMQLSWAAEVVSYTGNPVMILAPLAVSEQTIEQGKSFGIEVSRHTGDAIFGPNIYITNYERMDSVDWESVSGIVMDESSILKSQAGKTRTKLIEVSQSIPYRLSCTATPSPNDFDELGNQCEFLGVMKRTEMLATYFVNDTGDTGTWRLKGWGASKFWEWMGTWSVVLRNPSDLGFDGSSYILPKPSYIEHVVDSESDGDLFAKPAQTMTERRRAQRDSIENRCKALADVVNADTSEPWLIWTHLNDEAEMLAELIPGAVNVQGSDSAEFKVAASRWFCNDDSLQNDPLFCDKLSATEKELLGWTQRKKPNASTCASTTKRTEKSSGLKLKKNAISTTLQEKQGTHQTLSCSADIERPHRHGALPIQQNGQTSECADTGSQILTTSECLKIRTGGAPSADQQNQGTSLRTDSTLTTVTHMDMSEDCSVCHATTGSESSKTQSERLSGLSTTSSQPRKGRVLVSKAKMFGYGLNFQHCARMAFVGIDDSFEKFYQAVRRCYRFGQKRNVEVHLFVAENEGQVLNNLKRKELQHHEMSENMVDHMRDIMNNELKGTSSMKEEYREDVYDGEGFTVHLSDCVKLASKMEDNSIDYSVFSPPFADLFVYSNSDHDMGNCNDDDEFVAQLRFLITELFRVVKPGRNVSFHCMNLPTTKMRQGYIGLRDFRGDLIRAFQDAGFIYHSEVCIWKDPVVAMQRTKALGLLHKTIRENSTMSRMGLPDYVVTMRKPGQCDDRVTHYGDMTEAQVNDHPTKLLPVMTWQKYASPIWDDINQGRTLNRLPARDENDVKHMCPLQLDVIERCIHLWTNPGDLVFSPFAGIGSEGYCAVKMGRRFIGSELKPQYWELAVENIKEAASISQSDLFA